MARSRRWILAASLTAACAPLDVDVTRVEALTAPVLTSCSEAAIRANAPPDAAGMLDRAFNWIHRRVPYCQCVTSASSPFRADCSGFVSMVWRLSSPGLTTYSFAGGPWATGASVRLRSRNQLRVGDALNYAGNPRAGTGHIVLFGGWLDRAHTRFCSLEESRTGTPARVIVRNVDPVYVPIRLAGRTLGPLCNDRCSGNTLIDGDCERHACGTGRCVNDSHGARCVDRGCPTWGADAVCLDSRTVITCVNGDQRTRERCTGANSRCGPEGNRVRCESPTCTPTGRHDICLPSGEITTCSNGRRGTARDCPAGTFCSEAGPGDARCVSRRCVAETGETPVARTVCQTGGSRLICDAQGSARVENCPAGQVCSIPDGQRCVPFACPAGVRAAVCGPGNERVVCDRGVIVERARCAGTCASDHGTAARCIDTACAAIGGDGTALRRPAHGLCLPDGQLGHCDDEGNLARRPCADGARCVAAGDSATCEGAPPPVTPDAGVRDAGVAEGDAGAPVGDGGEEEEEPPFEDPDAGLVEDPDYDAGPIEEGTEVPAEKVDGGGPGGTTVEVSGRGCAVSPTRRWSWSGVVLGAAMLTLTRRRRRPR